MFGAGFQDEVNTPVEQMGSLTSLSVDRLTRKNEERLKRLKDIQGAVSLSAAFQVTHYLSLKCYLDTWYMIRHVVVLLRDLGSLFLFGSMDVQIQFTLLVIIFNNLMSVGHSPF